MLTILRGRIGKVYKAAIMLLYNQQSKVNQLIPKSLTILTVTKAKTKMQCLAQTTLSDLIRVLKTSYEIQAVLDRQSITKTGQTTTSINKP